MKLKTWTVALAVFLMVVLTITLLYRQSLFDDGRGVGTRVFKFQPGNCRFHETTITVGATGMDGCTFCICKAPDHLDCHNLPDCKSTGEKVRVVTTATEHTIGGAITLINSIHANTNSTVAFYVIVEDKETYDHLHTWLKTTSLKVVPVNIVRLPRDLIPTSVKSMMNYARHYLPQLLPMVIGRVLYIEPYSVVQGNILDLWNTPIASEQLVASSSHCNSVGKHFDLSEGRFSNYMNFRDPLIKQIKMVPSQCTFDDGVFVLDLHTWRSNKVSEQLKHWTETGARSQIFSNMGPGEEQLPPFLVVLQSRHAELDPLWSIRGLGSPSSRKYSQAFLKTAHLLQWSGPLRPWEGRADHTDLWDKYYIPDPTSHFHVVRKNHQ